MKVFYKNEVIDTDKYYLKEVKGEWNVFSQHGTQLSFWKNKNKYDNDAKNVTLIINGKNVGKSIQKLKWENGIKNDIPNGFVRVFGSDRYYFNLSNPIQLWNQYTGNYLKTYECSKHYRFLHKEIHIVVYQYYKQRYVTKGNQIHHLDGDPHNNSISNLMQLTIKEHRTYENLKRSYRGIHNLNNCNHISFERCCKKINSFNLDQKSKRLLIDNL